MAQPTIRAPRYLARFRCIGPACEDNCCAGWQALDVDAPSFARYQGVEDAELGLLLREHVARNEEPRAGPEAHALIVIPEGGQCPFFGPDRLCAIQQRLAEDWLPAGCDTFPRQATRVDGVIEVAGRLACPELARVALLAPDAMLVDEVGPDRRLAERGRYWVEEPWGELPAGDPRRDYHAVRAMCLDLLRGDGPVEGRLVALGAALAGFEPPVGGRPEGWDAGPPALLARRVAAWLAMAGVPERYRRCLERVRTVLEGDAAPARYAAGVGRFRAYVAAKPWVLQNWLLNQVLASSFPFHPQRGFFAEWAILACRYGLLKLHLVGAAAAEGELTDDLVVEAAQAFDKYPDSEDFWRRTLELLAREGALDPAGVAALIGD